jgi:hypothetical protein
MARYPDIAALAALTLTAGAARAATVNRDSASPTGTHASKHAISHHTAGTPGGGVPSSSDQMADQLNNKQLMSIQQDRAGSMSGAPHGAMPAAGSTHP